MHTYILCINIYIKFMHINIIYVHAYIICTHIYKYRNTLTSGDLFSLINYVRVTDGWLCQFNNYRLLPQVTNFRVTGSIYRHTLYIYIYIYIIYILCSVIHVYSYSACVA